MKLHDLYVKKHVGSDIYDDDDCDSGEVDKEELVFEMEGELINALCYLNKLRKKNNILKEEVSLLIIQVKEAEKK